METINNKIPNDTKLSVEKSPKIELKPLTEEKLEEAIALANTIFPHGVDSSEGAMIAYPASLNPEKYRDQLNSMGVSSLNYWLAFNKQNEVIGITGLYHQIDDADDIAWVGWYGVKPEERGKGIGRNILEQTIAKAQATGCKALRLYTSTVPNEATAQLLYEKLGFKIFKTEDVPGEEYKLLFREKKLVDIES